MAIEPTSALHSKLGSQLIRLTHDMATSVLTELVGGTTAFVVVTHSGIESYLLLPWLLQTLPVQDELPSPALLHAQLLFAGALPQYPYYLLVGTENTSLGVKGFIRIFIFCPLVYFCPLCQNPTTAIEDKLANFKHNLPET